MFSKIYIYTVLNKNTGGLCPCLGPTRFRERFRPPICSKNKANATDNFYEIIKVDMMFYLLYKVFNLNSSSFRL